MKNFLLVCVLLILLLMILDNHKRIKNLTRHISRKESYIDYYEDSWEYGMNKKEVEKRK